MIVRVLEAGRWFIIITAELSILFMGVTFLVGLISEYLSTERIQATLGEKNPWVAGILGTAFGAVTPFCSCSTIPILAGMLQAGVPFGAASSFLIASPLLNPVIVTMLITILGLKTAIGYSVLVFALAVVAGQLWAKSVLATDVKRVKIVRTTEDSQDGFGPPTRQQRLRNALSFAVSLFRQVLPYLVIGAAIGACIYGFVPEALVSRLAGPQNPLAVPAAAALGIPMYIRAETIIPIGAVLVHKGMSTGAVVALLIGGAGASIPELLLLGSLFKRRTVIAFALTVLVVAIITGTLVNLF